MLPESRLRGVRAAGPTPKKRCRYQARALSGSTSKILAAFFSADFGRLPTLTSENTAA